MHAASCYSVICRVSTSLLSCDYYHGFNGSVSHSGNVTGNGSGSGHGSYSAGALTVVLVMAMEVVMGVALATVVAEAMLDVLAIAVATVVAMEWRWECTLTRKTMRTLVLHGVMSPCFMCYTKGLFFALELNGSGIDSLCPQSWIRMSTIVCRDLEVCQCNSSNAVLFLFRLLCPSVHSTISILLFDSQS